MGKLNTDTREGAHHHDHRPRGFTMTLCTVFVRLRPLPGHENFTRSLILELIPEITAIDGCEVYELFDAVDGDLMIYERWTSREHWQAHFEQPAILRLKRELANRVELPVERLEAYPAG
jgi:quinol monooxygenase YgiN